MNNALVETIMEVVEAPGPLAIRKVGPLGAHRSTHFPLILGPSVANGPDTFAGVQTRTKPYVLVRAQVLRAESSHMNVRVIFPHCPASLTWVLHNLEGIWRSIHADHAIGARHFVDKEVLLSGVMQAPLLLGHLVPLVPGEVDLVQRWPHPSMCFELPTVSSFALFFFNT